MSSSDSPTTGRAPKLFTLAEANAMLPLVRAIVRDLRELSLDVIDRRDRLAHLLGGREDDTSNPYRAELADTERQLEQDARRLREYVQELIDLGVEPKNGVEGLVDFPSMMDGRVVYLCWKYDEPEILHWHELDAGFAGRQSLVASSASASSASSSGNGVSGVDDDESLRDGVTGA